MDYLKKYGYAPSSEAIGRSLEILAANLDKIASEQVYKDCFSMMDLTTLKTDDTPASVLKLVKKVNDFQLSRPDWPLPASVCVYSNFASVVKEERLCDFNITVVSAVHQCIAIIILYIYISYLFIFQFIILFIFCS